MVPDDLKGKDASTICKELFGEDLDDNPFWDLKREDDRSFRWTDNYLESNWSASHGYLVALHEVSTLEQAEEFALKNRIHLFEDGGIYLKGHGVAELFINCVGIPPREEIKNEDDLYRLKFRSGTVAKIGFASPLFIRLVAGPVAEVNTSFPDIKTLATLVLRDVEKDEVPSYADLSLFYFRNNFKGIQFNFWRLGDLHLAPMFGESTEELNPPRIVEDLKDAIRPEAISFFNRAKESGTIPGFLYFYRVLEACFDAVIDTEVSAWRSAKYIDCIGLMKKIRSLQGNQDQWALRKVLGEIIDQVMLDHAKDDGLVTNADADSLCQAIYARRNSIAHGRKGQGNHILVPYGFSLGDSGQHDRNWYDFMNDLAILAIEKWILDKR